LFGPRQTTIARIPNASLVSLLETLPQISEVLVHVEPEEELAAKHIARVK